MIRINKEINFLWTQVTKEVITDLDMKQFNDIQQSYKDKINERQNKYKA